MKKIFALVAVLTVLNVVLLVTTKRGPTTAPVESAPKTELTAGAPSAPVALPTARAVENSRPSEAVSAGAPAASPSMEPGDEGADPALLKKRADEERQLRDIREKTAAAMSQNRGS